MAENTLKVFKFVSKSFVIPSDFEKDHKVPFFRQSQKTQVMA